MRNIAIHLIRCGFVALGICIFSGELLAQPTLPTSNTEGTEDVGPMGDQPWVNGLGMTFVPIKEAGVWFSIWETRVQDYAAFAVATDRKWRKPEFVQGSLHPAVYVTFHDVNAFCKWLTDREQKEGRIRAGQQYRLPTDIEWSMAVGLPDEKEGTPKEKDARINDVYPWGKHWPPKQDDGNYDPSMKIDSFPYTAPVGAFGANAHGLYDMGGNVWEWCSDHFAPDGKTVVLRGASWQNDAAVVLLSSCRSGERIDDSCGVCGFRCVLAPISPPAGDRNAVTSTSVMKGTALFLCAKCRSAAAAAGKCGHCITDLVEMHVHAIEDGSATVCACAVDCKCLPKDTGKCSCGEDLIIVSLEGHE
jgi:hypothetical protein